MRAIRAWFIRLAGLLATARRDREMADELESHLQLHIDDNLRRGLAPEAARRDALIKLGGIQPTAQRCREQRGVFALESTVQDIRYAARGLRKSPAFTTTVLLTLALGIGANTAIFSFVNSILLQPLRYSDPDRLVQLKEYDLIKGVDFDWVSFPNFRDWADQNETLEATAAYKYSLFSLTRIDHPQTVLGLRASADLLPLLRARPLLGRTFLPDEDSPGHDHVVILSFDLWSGTFGQDRDIVGRSMTLDSEPYTIVGVMPPDFNFPPTVPISSMLPSRKMSLWVPLNIGLGAEHRDWNMLGVVARLKPRVTIASARAEMQTIAQNLEQQYPVENSGVGVHVELLRDQVVGNVRIALLVFLSAVSLVLLIACINVANLLVARYITRQQEIAVRTAIGASRSRIIRLLLTESLLLALMGAGLGVMLAIEIADGLRLLMPDNVPRAVEVSFNARMVAYAFAVSLFTLLIFGLGPALMASAGNLSARLKANGPLGAAAIRTSRLRNTLVVIEVSLSVVLLATSGLLFNSFLRLEQVDPGFHPDNLLTAWTVLPSTKYQRPVDLAEFYQRVLERIEALPGVEAAGAVDALPLTSIHPGGPFSIEGRPTDLEHNAPFAYRCTVSRDYFRTMQIRLVAGRELDDGDRPGAAGVVVINETAAHQYWPGDDPVGKRLSFTVGHTPAHWLRIVGVVGDVRQDGLDTRPTPTIYLPMLQAPMASAALVVRGTAARPAGFWPGQQDAPASNLAAGIKTAIAAVDKDQPIFAIRSMNDVYRDALKGRRFNMIVLTAFAILALVLGSIGVYGLTVYAVTNRSQEIGIRIALGARPRELFRLVIAQGLGLSLAGVGIGLVAALIVARLMSGLLFEVGYDDPITLTAASLILLSTVVLASFIAARRAILVDPTVALRS